MLGDEPDADASPVRQRGQGNVPVAVEQVDQIPECLGFAHLLHTQEVWEQPIDRVGKSFQFRRIGLVIARPILTTGPVEVLHIPRADDKHR
jgi:hypothetical protein